MRDFESELKHELKFHTHCSQKVKDPNHFCDQKELSRNLKMSLRDVRDNLHRMVKEGKLTHEKIVYKSRLRDKFTPVDLSVLSSKAIINRYKDYVDNELTHLNGFSKQVKKTPCVYNVRKVKNPITYYEGKGMTGAIKTMKGTSTTGKTSTVGYQLMTSFCDQCNRIFTYCDSLSYAQLTDIIKQDDEHILVVNALRKYTCDKIVKEIRFVLSDLTKLQKGVVESQILMRIPTVYHMLQIEKSSKLKISDF